jgi:hypothetical protein
MVGVTETVWEDRRHNYILAQNEMGWCKAGFHKGLRHLRPTEGLKVPCHKVLQR